MPPVTTSVRLDSGQLETLRLLADAEGSSVSDKIREALDLLIQHELEGPRSEETRERLRSFLQRRQDELDNVRSLLDATDVDGGGMPRTDAVTGPTTT